MHFHKLIITSQRLFFVIDMAIRKKYMTVMNENLIDMIR